MKKNLTLFLAGLLIGFSIGIGLKFLAQNAIQPPGELSIIDFLISEWTSPSQDSSQQQLAQFPSSIELPQARIGFIPDTIKSLALIVQQRYNVPKGVTTAQWILESRWGKNNLGVSNYFGHTFAAVKRYMKQPKSVKRWDTLGKKWLYFASHENIAECFLIHGQYLSQSRLYRSAFVQSSPEMFVREIAKHYAEDGDYALKLISIMRRYSLND